jgi:hypothetical protein
VPGMVVSLLSLRLVPSSYPNISSRSVSSCTVTSLYVFDVEDSRPLFTRRRITKLDFITDPSIAGAWVSPLRPL